MNGFRLSPLLQDYVSYVGQLGVYEKSVEILEKIAGITISAMQVNKVTDFYGSLCGGEVLAKPVLSAVDGAEKVYIGIDGSMLFTRDDGWKEVKVGRLFKASDCIRSSDGNVGQIRHSHYIAHLGDHKKFCEQMEKLIEAYGLKAEQIIFLSDGAPWIKNWIEDAYSQATSILDFYHAKEHFCEFAKLAIADQRQRNKWIEQQSDLLLDSKVSEVITNIRVQMREDCHQQALQLIKYYEDNRLRMDYKTYKRMGAAMIGSGAIESAHRTLVQQRCKLSGQRWSKKGAQHMLNLKATYLNEQWQKVVSFTQKAAA